MKNIFITLLLLLNCCFCRAQTNKVAGLLAQIEKTYDEKKVDAITGELLSLPQGNIALLDQGRRDLAKEESGAITKDRERALLQIAVSTFNLRYAPEMLDACLQGIHLSTELKDAAYLIHFMRLAGLAYIFQQDTRKGANYFIAAAKIARASHDTVSLFASYSNLESNYASLKMPDSALFIARLEMKIATGDSKEKKHDLGIVYADYGEALMAANKPDSALPYYRLAYQLKVANNQQGHEISYLENNIATAYLKAGKRDSAARYGLLAYQEALKTNYWEFKANAAGSLSQAYDGVDDKKSLFYLKEQLTATDSINGIDKQRQFNMIAEHERHYNEELKAAQERFNFRVQLYSLIGAALVLLAIGLILWRNNSKQKHTNVLLSEQKEEIAAQRDNLGHTLEELKTTQSQLVQREKMASLGELTAGIAHEIQNPLNFVNNFSEVSIELLQELKEEEEAGNKENVIAIAGDLTKNLEKIHHHGKRADFIVKGMLEHSRTNTGEKQLTDMNVLCDEFLKLSFHGLRAKDNSFNVVPIAIGMITDFDTNLPEINVSQQDMGRVMLNLFNNAFYAVNQKMKTAGPDYKAEVSVTTFAPSPAGGGWGVKVRDNGNGIPDAIKDKIMQPFFTTKPTGEGTGLGLSLSYDIVVKGHGGGINVSTKEGEFTEFIVTLPIN